MKGLLMRLKTVLAALMGLWMTPAAHAEPPAGGAQEAAPVSSLVIDDLKPGHGAVAQDGSRLTVHYTGWLYDPKQPHHQGKKFDSSLDRKQPFQFLLGAHQVIAGWEEGSRGMQVGGVRRLTIGPDLAYGERGAGGVIPPGATLIFEVQLLAVGE